jgi:hypothetical protein
MSRHDPDLQELLRRHGEGVRVTGDLAGRAIARDQSNRRREIGAVVVAAGLALAVAVPVTLASLRPGPEGNIPSGPTRPTVGPTRATTTPPTTSAPTTSVAPTPTAIPTIRATGAPAAAVIAPATGGVTASTDLGYVVDGVYVEGSEKIPLPAAVRRPGTVARLGDGLVIGRTEGGIVIVGAQGQVVRTLPDLDPTVVVSPDRTHVLTTTGSGDLVYLDATGARVARLRAEGGAGWGARALAGTTAYAVDASQTRTVAWDVVTGRTQSLRGAVTAVDPAGRFAVVTPATVVPGKSSTFCQLLLDLRTNATVWTLCGPTYLTRFSPDGAYLVGSGFSDGQPPELSNGPDGKPRYGAVVVVRTVDGEVVLQSGDSGTPAGSVGPGAFAPDGLLVVPVGSGGGRQSLQQCRLDGSCESVGEALASPTPDIPEGPGAYVLARG